MDILSRIVGDSKAALAERKRTRTIASIRAGLPVRTHDRFRDMFSGTDIVLIAEVKKASPSKGVFTDTFDPAAIAREYGEAGADAVSVLTEENHFLGAMHHLSAVRSAVALPILRKDFIIDEYQIYEACAAGADSFLLIAAILDDAALLRFIALGTELAMTPLVEVHSERELDRALAVDAAVIGINNRDLTDFRTTLDTTTALAPKVPSGRFIVSESGIVSHEDVARVRAAGVHGVLVGETLMRASDVKAKIWELKGRK